MDEIIFSYNYDIIRLRYHIIISLFCNLFNIVIYCNIFNVINKSDFFFMIFLYIYYLILCDLIKLYFWLYFIQLFIRWLWFRIYFLHFKSYWNRFLLEKNYFIFKKLLDLGYLKIHFYSKYIYCCKKDFLRSLIRLLNIDL